MTDDNGIAGTGIKLGTTLYSLDVRVRGGPVHARDPHRRPPRNRESARASSSTSPRCCARIPTSPTSSSRSGATAFDKHGLERQRVRHEPRHGSPQGARHDARRGARLPRAAVAGRAHTLGFKKVVIRSHGKELLRSLLPLAEKLRPEAGLRDPRADRAERPGRCCKMREMYDELDPPLLGFVADFSSTMHSHVADAAARPRADGHGREALPRSCRRSGTSRRRCRCATEVRRTT